MKTEAAVWIISLLLLCSCSVDNSEKSIEKINVDFVWDLKHPQRSPEVHLGNTPKGTDRLQIEFIDATNEWEHGGGNIPFDGSGTIQAGALKGFKGISSMWGIPKIELTVAALNKNGQVIGKGNIIKSPPDHI
ncbi:hypothetical protein [Desulfosarcina sp.]|uniref:hypothetical protein n=1 Tax=Desulfosarcina sp. TaxID=2027861 RepID=UPI003970A337